MKFSALIFATALFSPIAAQRECLSEVFPPQVKSVLPEAWKEPEVLFTVGQTCNGYTPPGIPDGMGAYRYGNTVRLFVNHELGADRGYPYGKSHTSDMMIATVRFCLTIDSSSQSTQRRRRRSPVPVSRTLTSTPRPASSWTLVWPSSPSATVLVS